MVTNMGERRSIYLSEEIIDKIELYRRRRAMQGKILNFSQAISELVEKGIKASKDEIKF